MSTKVVVHVPREGYCIAIVYENVALRASCFMELADAESLCGAISKHQLIRQLRHYNDVLAVNHDSK